jgi:dipeptidyl-peptidase-4
MAGRGRRKVANRWADGLLFDELLAQHGFAVLHADNRGTGMRGRDFAQAAYHNFGPVQLEDQLTVSMPRWPSIRSWTPNAWAGGAGAGAGPSRLYAMSHSDRFRAGVAVAPVTDWRNYDSIYTERYMSEPGDFPDRLSRLLAGQLGGQSERQVAHCPRHRATTTCTSKTPCSTSRS